MRYVWVVILSCVLDLSVCAPPPKVIDTPTAHIQTPIPLPTPTVPFSVIDLGDLLIQASDYLPTSYSGVQLGNNPPPKYGSIHIPAADYTIQQEIEKDMYSSGFVTILLYENRDNLEEAYYRLVIPRGESSALDGIGRKGQIFSSSHSVPPIVFKWVELTFVQCNAVVDISLTGTDNEQDVTAYAKHLARSLELEPLVCR